MAQETEMGIMIGTACPHCQGKIQISLSSLEVKGVGRAPAKLVKAAAGKQKADVVNDERDFNFTV